MTFLSNPSLETSSSESSKSNRGLPSQKSVKNHFHELMRSEVVDDKPKKKDLFSLVSDQEACLKQLVVTMPCEYSEPPCSIAGASTVESAASPVSPEVYVLFEKLCSTMLIQTHSHSVETTFLIDNPDSVFFGTEITIKEFSTAPKIFNIEIVSHSTAISILELHSVHLFHLLQQEHLPFSVHRLETHIRQEADPLVSLDREMGDDQQEKEGESQS